MNTNPTNTPPLTPALIHLLADRIAATPASEYRRDGRTATPLIVIKLTTEERDLIVQSIRHFCPTDEEVLAMLHHRGGHQP